MYAKLAKALKGTRESLHSACHQLGINSEALQPEKMTVVACDNCSYWDVPKNMLEEDDGTLYCSACVEVGYLNY